MHIIQIDTSYDELESNIDYYIDLFKQNKVLQFKKINITEDQHRLISQQFHSRLGYFPAPEHNKILDFSYDEDHSHVTSKKINEPNILLIDWHLEHIQSSAPPVIGSWNMHSFTCETTSGRTIFVDSADILNLLSADQLNFLKKCEVKVKSSDPDEKGNSFSSEIRSAIAEHPVTGDMCLRLSPRGGDCLYSVDGKKPTAKEERFFDDIPGVSDAVQDDYPEMIHYLSWSQGDLVFVDTFCCYHAVLGGFSSEDRKFTGRWGFKHDEYTFNIMSEA